MKLWQRLAAWSTAAASEHWLPLLILVAPINWVVWQSDADSVYPFLVLPAVAFVVGMVRRPRHVWLVWLGSVMLEWIVVGLWGKYDDPGSGETIGSIMLEAFGWMAMGVLLPVWYGRFTRAVLDEWRRGHGRRGRSTTS